MADRPLCVAFSYTGSEFSEGKIRPMFTKSGSVKAAEAPSKLPPPWIKHGFWRVHRILHRLSGGRFLWTPASRLGWGAMSLTTTGRRSGQPRTVIVGYIEDGTNLVTMAMNGWDEGHPAWWRNLEANPEATVRLAGRRPQTVHARAASGDERDRLWKQWSEIDTGLDTLAANRVVVTPIVVLTPFD